MFRVPFNFPPTLFAFLTRYAKIIRVKKRLDVMLGKSGVYINMYEQRLNYF